MSFFQLRLQSFYSNNICVKCWENVKNFCQFRKELVNNQALLYQIFNEEDRVLKSSRDDNFIDISQAVKIKLEVAEGDSFNSNEMHFESEATMQDVPDSTPYHFKMESHQQSINDMGIYSK